MKRGFLPPSRDADACSGVFRGHITLCVAFIVRGLRGSGFGPGFRCFKTRPTTLSKRSKHVELPSGRPVRPWSRKSRRSSSAISNREQRTRSSPGTAALLPAEDQCTKWLLPGRAKGIAGELLAMARSDSQTRSGERAGDPHAQLTLPREAPMLNEPAGWSGHQRV